MATWRPDPTFYPSPRLATQAPPEKLAYVATLDPTRKRPDVMAVVDVDSKSTRYGRIVGQTDLAVGDELHHFGWNACSSCLCPQPNHASDRVGECIFAYLAIIGRRYRPHQRQGVILMTRIRCQNDRCRGTASRTSCR